MAEDGVCVCVCGERLSVAVVSQCECERGAVRRPSARAAVPPPASQPHTPLASRGFAPEDRHPGFTLAL